MGKKVLLELTLLKTIVEVLQIKSPKEFLNKYNLNIPFYIVETKVPGGQLTVDRIINGKKVYGQKEWGERMAAHGAIRHIYHSLEEGMEIIKSIINNFPISK